MSNTTRSAIAAVKVRPTAYLAVAASIVGVVLLATGLSAFFCLHFLSQVLDVVAAAPAATAEVNGTLAAMYQDLFIMLVAIVLILSVVVTLILYYQLSRLTGAEFALNRHLREKLLQGDLSPVSLRKGDFLQELAANLNHFVEKTKGPGRP
jgi:methyl-accepting chemotaxis protein